MTAAQPSIHRRLWTLALPVAGLNTLQVLTLAVDTAMLGRLEASDLALTAIGFASQVAFLLMVAMMGLTVGTVALVARAYGAGDHERVNHLLQQGSQLTILVGLAVAIGGNLVAPFILQLLGASGEAVDEALLYLRPLLLGAPVLYLAMLYTAVMRGVGNTRLPFLVALVSNGLNIVANYGFIFGAFGLPALGITGAAVGTVLSGVFSVAVLAWWASGKRVNGLDLKYRLVALDGPLARTFFRLGWPAAGDMVLLNAGFLTIIGLLGRIDEVAVAAHGIGIRLQALAFVPGLGISQACAALVGQALGRGQVEEARSVLRAALFQCTAVMSVGAFAFTVFAPQIVRLFFDVQAGTALEGFAVTWIRQLGVLMPVAGLHIAFVGLLQGAGATRTSLKINLVGTLVIQIPLSVLLGTVGGLGAFGVWLAFPLSFVVRAAHGYLLYRGGRWAMVGGALRAGEAR